MFNISDKRRDNYMLSGSLMLKGYDWWWHSFTAVDRKTGEKKPFFIEFYLCNPGFGGRQPVLGQSEYNRNNKRRPSYMMVKVGTWGEDHCQLHRFFGWKDVKIREMTPFQVSCADCLCSETRLKGSVKVSAKDIAARPELMCDAGSMEWDLTVSKEIAFNVGYGASSLFRKMNAFEMYWHAEGMKTRYSGHIMYNGRRYTVNPDSCFGYADKNWGKDFTSPWLWLSSNNLTSKITGRKLDNSVFDIGGGRPRVFFFPLPRKLLGAFYYEGREFEFNFSKFWTKPKTQFAFSEDSEFVYWHVRQENKEYIMDTRIKCRKAEMLFINYEAPNGEKKHNRLWNGGTGTGIIRLYRKTPGKPEIIDVIQAKNVGCEYGEYDK